METGKTYDVITNDGETLPGGLCSACPYEEIVSRDV